MADLTQLADEPTEVASPGAVMVCRSPVHGLGVFATDAFEEGDLIEACPVLVVPADQASHLEWTSLSGYYFHWDNDAAGLALGYGSLYNHSWTPNARYDHDYENGVIEYSAVRSIEAGEEITINYLGEPDGRGELWFDAGEPPP
jgi:SET domain-containing protein